LTCATSTSATIRRSPRPQLWEFVSGHYLAEHAAILLCGPTGVGKSFVAQALGVQACRQRQRVFFTKTAALLSDLRGAASMAPCPRAYAATSAPICSSSTTSPCVSTAPLRRKTSTRS